MSIPELLPVIYVSAFPYTVTHETPYLQRMNLLAEADFLQHNIKLRDDVDDIEQVQCLIHELLHVIQHIYAPYEEPSEGFIEGMANGILDLIVHNPDILTLLQEFSTWEPKQSE